MDTRTDSGQYYPGGKVLPRQPGGGGGGGTVVLDDTVTATSSNGVKASGIWSWVKSLLPSWLTPSREEPPTQESIVGRRPVKQLPKYLHALSFDDPYKADAEAWYESLAPDAMVGACSAVRRGGKLYRNYDWTFDNAAEFVVRMSASEGRHASVGVASLGAALTEDEAASGVYTAKYRALPGMTLDGINDAGVVAEINVDGGPRGGWHGDADDGGIHILAAVRWVLDNADSAASAAEWLANHIIQPTGDMNFHFMVADATKTYIVENGDAHDATNDETKALTNFGVYDDDQRGSGRERYDLLSDGADISAVHWTKAYKSGNTWDSDFESEAQHAAAIEQWAAQGEDREAHRGKTTESGKPWWQTVHTTEYDFAARTMRVAVQESGEYFTFAVDQFAEKLATKRDRTDRQWGERTFSWPTVNIEGVTVTLFYALDDGFIPGYTFGGSVTYNDSAFYFYLDAPRDSAWEGIAPTYIEGSFPFADTIRFSRTETTDKLALLSDIPTTPPSLPYLRVWDEQSQCWWKGVMQGGVLNWEVEEES